MEDNSGIMVLKKQKLLDGEIDIGDQLCNNGNDRISNLPEEVINRIFYFLGTKHSARTCVLSKRWMHLWTSIPILDIGSWYDRPRNLTEEAKPLYVNRLMDFVDRTLLHHVSNIQTFHLNCRELSNDSRMNAWISFLVRRKVEKLVIQDAQKVLLPSCLFTSKSLTRLELDGILDFNFPKSVHFPKLKILKLVRVHSSGTDISERLFSSCPVLEDLSIHDCKWNNVNRICISTPTLKKLRFSAMLQPVKISAPNLVSLFYSGSLANIFVSQCVSIVDVSITVWLKGKDDTREMSMEERVSASRLLGEVCNVKNLIFSGYLPKDFCRSGDSTNQPTFCNLTHLKLYSDLLCYSDKALLNLLKTSPNLESLFFESLSPYLSDDDGEESTLYTEPQPLLLNLKSVEFFYFEGHIREMGFVKFLLKNSIVLKTMTIRKVDSLSYVPPSHMSSNKSEVQVMEAKLKRFEFEMKMKDEEMKVMKEVHELPRASSSCVILFDEPY